MMSWEMAKSVSDPYFPVTFNILEQIGGILKKDIFSPHTDLLLLSVCQMAFLVFSDAVNLL